jgi:hypothetical protein
MAIKKTKQINSDISANYWNIESFNFHKPSMTLAVCLALYTSQASRENNELPIHRENLQLNEIDSSELVENPFVFIYEHLKEDPTVLPVLVSEEEPEETENDEETGELIVTKAKVPAVYESFFADAEDLV